MTDFFRINLPYGMQRNDKGEWCFFNREYTYLGSKERVTIEEDSPFYCHYEGITDKLLEDLAADSSSITRNEKNEIVRVWFYGDATNQKKEKLDAELWDMYQGKLKILCNLKRAM